ncbi:MAG: peptidoglycan DD-metalloendopeptidase family protein [Chloroflexi bacterium]|nr:peptidoglycan DD-metalloendopeptidase family protein [Chloroflexota bacterium]
MGAPRSIRGGGVWKRGLRTGIVVLATAAFLIGQHAPALADDPLADLLRQKADLERAVQISRQNAERYRQVAGQYDAAAGQAIAHISELADQQNAAQSEAEALGYQIAIAEEQLQLVAFQMNETKALIDALKSDAASQSRLLGQREQQYGRHLRLTYRQALVSPLEMLLSSSSLAEFAGRLQAMVLVNRQDVQLANEIRVLRTETAAKQELASDKEKEILGLQDQVTKQRAALATNKLKYDGLVAEAQSSIDKQELLRQSATGLAGAARQQQSAATRELGQLNKQLEQTEALYEDLVAQQAARSGLAVFNGSKLPLWPIRGPLTSGFGPRWGGFHNGIDIAAPMFTTLRAACAGEVTTVGRPYIASGDTAVVVIIACARNFGILYGHLDDKKWPIVKVGQRVQAGDPIGYVGMTGWTTGPHLHFMTILNGRAVDPMPYMP